MNVCVASSRGPRQVWSHHVWMILLHDVLNQTSAVAFRPGVRIGLVRHVYPRLLKRGNCRHGPAGKCTISGPLEPEVAAPGEE